MEDFSETFLQPVNDEIVVPAGDGAEAFVSVEDIAAVAAVTLTEPGRHAGRAYAPTGPQALTMAEAAAMISAAAGRTVTYRDTDREQWIAAMVGRRRSRSARTHFMPRFGAPTICRHQGDSGCAEGVSVAT